MLRDIVFLRVGQSRSGRPCRTAYVSEIGPLNQVSHLWEFDSLADIEERRAAIAADPEFKKYLDATDGMVVAQEDRIVRRVPFKSLP